MYAESTVSAFLDALASSAPVPGGGSTAALSGALAAALVSMVCQLTVGKRRFREAEPALREVLAEADALRQRLTALMERDAAAYGAVMHAYRLAKETPEEQAARHRVLQEALWEATLAPLEIAEGCARVLELALPAAELGNPWAVSDAGAAALLAEAALHAALLNVPINVSNLADPDRVAEARRRQQELAERAGLKERVLALAHERMAA